jgi:recombination associated protein RdgC
MGFFSGRVTFTRFQVDKSAPRIFGPDHLAKLAEQQSGRQRIASADGVETGWTAGDHILDTRFDLAKNIINDMLFFALRIDVQKLPGDLLRAYYQVDLEALIAGNPSGKPSPRQKREAKESARERLEHEARDGRFLNRKAIEVIWDRLSNEVYFGATSATHVDRLMSLFKNTFNHGYDSLTAGRRAYQLAEMQQRSRGVDDASPSIFVPGASAIDVAWILDEGNKDFVGNEFLLWLWFRTQTEDDTFKLSDDSEVTVMLARTLTLECPRGQTGYETITHESPIKLPEARRAIQSGKLPRKAGMTLVRHDVQYEFTLHAETLAVSGAKLPPSEEEDDRARLDERATRIRHLMETLDLLFDAFGQVRFTSKWAAELTKMQKWLKREDKQSS